MILVLSGEGPTDLGSCKTGAEPGNDKAPNPAKEQLQTAMQAEPSRATLVEWIESHGFRWEAVSEQMPSFAAFITRLSDVLEHARQKSGTPE